MDYEAKFPRLIKLCDEAKARGAEFVIIDHPEVLGDTYGEIVESLNHIADADLKLLLVPRRGRGPLPGGQESSLHQPEP